MRITQKMMTDSVNRNLSKNSEKLIKIQNRVSTGKEITKASDDPIGMASILDYRKTLSSIDQYTRNINQARSGIEVAEFTLSGLGELMIRAKELTLAQVTGTVGKDDRQTAALELTQIRDQFIQLANSRHGSRYLFGGRKTDALPYDPASPEDGFQGDDGNIPLVIGDSITLDTRISGKQAFASTIDPVVVLTNLIQDLKANDTLSISGKLDMIDQSMTQIMDSRAEVGAKLNRLDHAENHLNDLKINIQEHLSNREDADLTQAIMDLTAQQSAFQATIATASKIIQPTLLDFLR